MISRRIRARVRRMRVLLLITSINIAVFVFVAGPAIAQAFRVAGGLSAGAADALYCKLTGCTMTGSFIPANANGGCNTVKLQFGTSTTTGICDASGGTRPRWISNGVAVFEASSTVGFSDFLDFTLAGGKFQNVQSANLTVSTTTAPTGSFLRLSSVGAVAWTPGNGSAVNGQMINACNVDAEGDVITMTDGTTYEGSGCVLGINDCVTFIYDSTTTKYRELSCNNN